jgi:hypothetical protein
VSVGGERAGGKLGEVAATRHRSLVLTLATLTGIGLFFIAGLRDPTAWSGFAIATIVALVVSARLFTNDAANATERAEPEVEPAAPPSGWSEAEAAAPVDPDQVDYLRALRHEFRTPLNAVLGFSDVLLSGIDGEVNASQREDLEIIRASGIRLRLLLDSALDISQLAEGQLRLDIDRVDVGELVGRAVAEAGQLWSNKREAHFELPQRDCVAEVDEARFRRCLLVLADFLANAERDAEISMSLWSLQDYLAIEIKAEPSGPQSLDSLPTTAEVLAAEDATRIRQWPVAVTSELIGRHGGFLYHGGAPMRFQIRLPVREGV